MLSLDQVIFFLGEKEGEKQQKQLYGKGKG